MIDTDNFIARLEAILRYYALSASAMADKIKVQRSSISHLLSGRNKPSLDFVLKVVSSFPEVNLYWLLLGEGTFPQKNRDISPIKSTEVISKPKVDLPKRKAAIDKIVIFYKDNSFETYNPK